MFSRGRLFSGMLAILLWLPTTAEAQEDPEGPPADSSLEDGSRRRRLTAAGGGLERVSDSYGTSLTATMAGLDVHFGTQLNDTIGVYVPLHLYFGAFSGLGTVAGIPAGLTGTLAATVVIDATFVDRVFVGGGGGIGVLNRPTGPAIHLRAGGYPLVSRAKDSNRRRGLAVAVDLRLIYARGFNATYPTLSIGYASF